MPLIDSSGRVFGRWSIIDVAVVGALVALVLIGAGAVLLFRTPIPTLAAITPRQIAAEQPETLLLSGADFRSFLTVRIGPMTAPILVESPSTAEVRVAGLPSGTYDVVLFDDARELVRMADALTVAPPESTIVDVQVLGTFIDLLEQDAARVRLGSILEEEVGRSVAGQVLAVRPSETSTWRFRSSVYDASVVTATVSGRTQVRAIVSLRCVVTDDRCKINEENLIRDAVLTFAIPGSDSATSSESPMDPAWVIFRIDEIRPADEPAEFGDLDEPVVWIESAEAVVRATFVASPEAAVLVKEGDVDFRASSGNGGSGVGGAHETLRATILSIDTERENVIATRQASGALVTEPMVTFEATLRIPVDLLQRGWSYAGQTIKVGSPLSFDGRAYTMDGWVRAVQVRSGVQSAER